MEKIMRKLLLIPAASVLCLSPLALAAPPGMTETEEMVAKMQIQELMYRYAWTHNTDDAAGNAALFTEDAELLSVKGRDAILKMAQGEVKKLAKLGVSKEGDYQFGFMRTQVINPVIDIIDATHAKGSSYLQVVVPDVNGNNVPTILSVGVYQDEYRKVDGKWLIARRKAGFSSQMNDPGLGVALGLRSAPAQAPASGAAR